MSYSRWGAPGCYRDGIGVWRMGSGCWYVFAHVEGGLVMWGPGASEPPFPDAEVRRMVAANDPSAVSGREQQDREELLGYMRRYLLDEERDPCPPHSLKPGGTR